MARVPFRDWWLRTENQQNFWRNSYRSVPVSLGERSRYIFWQILQLLMLFHEQGVGYGNLLWGVFIGDNMRIAIVIDGFNPNNQGEPFAVICKDLLDFQALFNWVSTEIPEIQNVGRSYSANKFDELYHLLPRYCLYGIDGLRRFGFFVRNNPLFFNVTATFLLYRKMLTCHECNGAPFPANVWLHELQNWSGNVTNPDLVAVRDFRQNITDTYPTNRRTYARPDGSIVFFRNCERHVRQNNVGVTFYDDARILVALEDDLPMVIPTLFLAFVHDLDLNRLYDWKEFLSMHPTVFI